MRARPVLTAPALSPRNRPCSAARPSSASPLPLPSPSRPIQPLETLRIAGNRCIFSPSFLASPNPLPPPSLAITKGLLLPFLAHCRAHSAKLSFFVRGSLPLPGENGANGRPRAENDEPSRAPACRVTPSSPPRLVREKFRGGKRVSLCVILRSAGILRLSAPWKENPYARWEARV